MSEIRCTARIVNIADWPLVCLPRATSQNLSSRGLVLIEGTINDLPFVVQLEPDGKGSHWFRIIRPILQEGELSIGNEVELVFTQTDNWPDPDLPPDLHEALQNAKLYAVTWQNISPRAKWEWIRWIRSAKHASTRRKRIEVALDKLKQGIRRPCCFNSAMCTEPHVSHNGVLMDEA